MRYRPADVCGTLPQRNANSSTCCFYGIAPRRIYARCRSFQPIALLLAHCTASLGCGEAHPASAVRQLQRGRGGPTTAEAAGTR